MENYKKVEFKSIEVFEEQNYHYEETKEEVCITRKSSRNILRK